MLRLSKIKAETLSAKTMIETYQAICRYVRKENTIYVARELPPNISLIFMLEELCIAIVSSVNQGDINDSSIELWDLLFISFLTKMVRNKNFSMKDFIKEVELTGIKPPSYDYLMHHLSDTQ